MSQHPRVRFVALTASVGLALAVVAHQVLEPLPWPGLGALLGGLALTWPAGRASPRAALVGGLLGTLAGVAVHLASHRTEERMAEPAEGLAAHLGVDAGIGLLVAVPALVFTLALARRVLAESAE